MCPRQKGQGAEKGRQNSIGLDLCSGSLRTASSFLVVCGRSITMTTMSTWLVTASVTAGEGDEGRREVCKEEDLFVAAPLIALLLLLLSLIRLIKRAGYLS